MPIYSSRLAKNEQKKMVRQTSLLILMSIVILLLFIFVIMPNAIRLFFKFIDGSKGMDSGDTLPPQVPVLSAPLEATYSATLAVSGYGEPQSEVVFMLDGIETIRQQIDDSGNFKLDLPLQKGDNDVQLYGEDKAGNKSANSHSYMIASDDQPPEIVVDSPIDKSTIELRKNQQLPVTGKTEVGAKLYLNDRLVFVKGDGAFSTTYQLAEGENKLKFKSVDKAGNITEKELSVMFKL